MENVLFYYVSIVEEFRINRVDYIVFGSFIHGTIAHILVLYYF
jgi:hypothetical protein